MSVQLWYNARGIKGIEREREGKKGERKRNWSSSEFWRVWWAAAVEVGEEKGGEEDSD